MTTITIQGTRGGTEKGYSFEVLEIRYGKPHTLRRNGKTYIVAMGKYDTFTIKTAESNRTYLKYAYADELC